MCVCMCVCVCMYVCMYVNVCKCVYVRTCVVCVCLATRNLISMISYSSTRYQSAVHTLRSGQLITGGADEMLAP